ncbi:putative aaa atpase [Anaeramoeba flamelloides]|uniref:Aaa atpase n=1 Tax=Anaeramoeba flamelloides TaxID=1746091 RepID=A0AAV8AGB6_9EUKA|nr:putative aaa atpase [Anaeramoeba flamelloides]
METSNGTPKQTQTQKHTTTKKYGPDVLSLRSERAFEEIQDLGFETKYLKKETTRNESVRALSSMVGETQPLQQKTKTYSRYANLFSLFGSRLRIPIYKLPFEFGSSKECNSRLFGRNGEFSFSLANILIDNLTKLRYLRVHGKTGKVLLNGGRLAHGHKIILKDGDNIEFIGKYGKRYSFIFLTEEFLSNRQNKLTRSNHQNQKKGHQNQNLKNQRSHQKGLNECRSFQKYFQILPLKQRFCRGILLNKFRSTNRMMTSEGRNYKFSSIEYPIDQTLTKLLKMNFQTHLNDLLSSTPKQNLKSSFKIQERKEGRKLLLTGPLSSMFLIEKISKALANELGLKYFVFDFLEMVSLLKVFKTIIKKKEQQKLKNQKQKQNKNQSQQQQQNKNDNKNQNQKTAFKNGDRILYVGPNFQNIDSDRLIKALSFNWKQKKSNNNNNNNNTNNQSKTFLSGPKPGSFGKVVMTFAEESSYSSPYVGVEFDQPLPNIGCNLGISKNNKNHNNRNGFFVKKSEIIKLDESVDQDHPAILCQELFSILKKINEPFLLFIPKIEQTMFYSYHILECLKSGINNLIDNNPNAFIISGLEIGNKKLSRSQSLSIIKTLQQKQKLKQQQQQQQQQQGQEQTQVQQQQQKSKQKQQQQQLKNQLNSMNNEEKIEYLNKKLELLNKFESLSPIKKLMNNLIFKRDTEMINFLSIFLGQIIRIRKPKKLEQIEKWEKCVKIDQKRNLIQHNCSLMKFMCKKMKISIKLKQINSNLFILKRYNFEEMNSILGHAMSHTLQKKFLRSESNNTNTNTNNIILENDDLIYGFNLFHELNNLNKINIPKLNQKNDKEPNSKMDIEKESGSENENENENERERERKNGNERLKKLSTLEQNLYQEIVVPKALTKIKFKDIGGMKKIKKQIKEQIIYPFNRPELYQNFKLLQRKNFKGLLLYGPPGTGKTMIAQAIATECNCTFLNITPALFSSKWYGVAEKNVQAIFSIAKKLSPSIIFIDEVDSILSKRTSDGNLERETSRRIKNLFMQHWEGIKSNGKGNILVIGATNRPYDLDEAILRRFEKKVSVPLPDLSQRKQILKTLLLKNNLVSDDFNLNELSLLTKGFTGSDLKNLITTSSYYPIYEQLQSENPKISSLNNNFKIPNLNHFNKNNTNSSSSSLASDNNVQIKLRKLQLEDFKKSLLKIKSSININSLDFKLLNKWHSEYSISNISIENNFKSLF